MKTPFRCQNNQCKPVKFAILYNDDGCDAEIICPKHKPFQCSDGECVGDRSFCRVLQPCPEEIPYRCVDRTCAKNA